MCTGLWKHCKMFWLREAARHRRVLAAVSYRIPRQVTKCRTYRKGKQSTCYPVCPRCNIGMEREYMAFCDRCRQRLARDRFPEWSGFCQPLLFSCKKSVCCIYHPVKMMILYWFSFKSVRKTVCANRDQQRTVRTAAWLVKISSGESLWWSFSLNGAACLFSLWQFSL